MKIKVPANVSEKLTSLTKKDFKVDHFKASGPGGQNRNKNATAVRITHKKTGISAEAVDSKSQASNKKKAFLKLTKKLIEHFKKLELDKEVQVKSTERIRTYNQKRDEVVDHRTGTSHSLKLTLEGELDKFVEALIQKGK